MGGIDKHLASMQAIVLNGQSYKPNELKALYQADNAAIDATESAHKTLSQKVLDERASRAATAKVTRALRSFLLSYFGEEAVAILGDFGLDPKPRAATSVATKALAAAKAVATRKARGVRGSVQKLDVTGGVTGATLSETGSGAQIAPIKAAETSSVANAPAAAHAAASAGQDAAPVKTGPQS